MRFFQSMKQLKWSLGECRWLWDGHGGGRCRYKLVMLNILNSLRVSAMLRNYLRANSAKCQDIRAYMHASASKLSSKPSHQADTWWQVGQPPQNPSNFLWVVSHCPDDGWCGPNLMSAAFYCGQGISRTWFWDQAAAETCYSMISWRHTHRFKAVIIGEPNISWLARLYIR